MLCFPVAAAKSEVDTSGLLTIVRILTMCFAGSMCVSLHVCMPQHNNLQAAGLSLDVLRAQARDDLQTQRQAAQLAQLNLDRNLSEQPKGQKGAGAKIALDARTRPPAQSADELDGHVSDESE